MKIMIDLNILLDVFQKREPHYYASSMVLNKVLMNEISGDLPAHAITTIYYLVLKFSNRDKAIEVIDLIIKHFGIVPADKSVFINARGLNISDFEDAVVASLAKFNDDDFIITRNVSDFKNFPVKAMMPTEFLAIIESV
ncbi:MAG: PIN domain-containing protein [Candidatus Cloacimonetes bacterium]|nr:PIN domain-containing protein [Candidatus Cloacimonadota bacterium]